MNTQQANEAFKNCSAEEKINFLVRFSHALTILARDTYEVGGDGIINPLRLRIINEIQHRVTSFFIALMDNDAKRYPDNIFLKIILEHPEDVELQRQLRETFDRIISQTSAPTALV